jgi:hypothetical protein
MSGAFPNWKSFSRWRREAGITNTFGGFGAAHITLIVNPRKGTSDGTPDFLSSDTPAVTGLKKRNKA